MCSKEEHFTSDCISSFLFFRHRSAITTAMLVSRAQGLLHYTPHQQLCSILQVLCVCHERLKMHSAKWLFLPRGCFHSSILPIQAHASSTWPIPQAIRTCIPPIFHHLLNVKAATIEIFDPLMGSSSSWSQEVFQVYWEPYHFTERQGGKHANLPSLCYFLPITYETQPFLLVSSL